MAYAQFGNGMYDIYYMLLFTNAVVEYIGAILKDCLQLLRLVKLLRSG